MDPVHPAVCVYVFKLPLTSVLFGRAIVPAVNKSKFSESLVDNGLPSLVYTFTLYAVALLTAPQRAVKPNAFTSVAAVAVGVPKVGLTEEPVTATTTSSAPVLLHVKVALCAPIAVGL